MHHEDTEKFCFTSEALKVIRSFSPEEYRAFLDLHRAMQSAGEVREKAEVHGMRIVMGLFALCTMTFIMLFLVAVVGTLRTAYHPPAPSSIFSWAMHKQLFVSTCLAMMIFLPFVGVLWLATRAGVLLGRFTRKEYIKAAYQEAATYFDVHREYLDRPLDLLRMMDEDSYRTDLKWLVRFGGPTSALVAGRI